LTRHPVRITYALRISNDMPIVQPAGFDAMGLVPFQINSHCIDAAPSRRHVGETREGRLPEYLDELAPCAELSHLARSVIA
jgi:peptidase E